MKLRPHRIEVRLSDVEHRWAKQLAERAGVSMADLIRLMLAHQKRFDLGMMKTGPELGRRGRAQPKERTRA